LSELKAKKSQIFSLSIHSNHVKKEVAFTEKIFGMTHKYRVKRDNKVLKLKTVIKASKNLRFFDALITVFNFKTLLSLFTTIRDDS
jgi:hypothetical protein